MKIIFAGTPEFAVLPLQKIRENGFEVAAVLTQPDKPQGRKGILTPSPVKAEAQKSGLPVLQPIKLKEDFSSLVKVGADLMVTCAYGQILTREILDLFPLGVWNIHASLLPGYRGAAPIARAIIDGCERTGITVMKTDIGLDTGDILLKAELSIDKTDTCGTLSEKLSALGAELIIEALGMISSGGYTLQEQGEGFICKKVQHAAVDFSRTAKEVSALIRGLSPAPLAYGKLGELTLNFFLANEVPHEGDEPYGTVLAASPKEGLIIKCGGGAVKITELQPAGGKRMNAKDFCNGRKIEKGQRFENERIL